MRSAFSRDRFDCERRPDIRARIKQDPAVRRPDRLGRMFLDEYGRRASVERHPEQRNVQCTIRTVIDSPSAPTQASCSSSAW